MIIDKRKWYIWASIQEMDIEEFLTEEEYKVITSLQGLKGVKRIPLKDLASMLCMTEDEVMDIHTIAMLKIGAKNEKA